MSTNKQLQMDAYLKTLLGSHVQQEGYHSLAVRSSSSLGPETVLTEKKESKTKGE